MNKNIFLSIALFLLMNFSIKAQNSLTQNVKGQVIDNVTKQPITGVSVVILNSNPVKGVITDDNGYFKLETVSIGRVSLLFSYLGYENYVKSEILVGSAKEVSLTIPLVESLESLNEIVISSKKDQRKPNNPFATVSARSFTLEDTKRFPASISDPGRMALSFAGVSNSDDETNEIIVRGNAPNQLLWRIEGVEVPEPNHFSEEGYSSGAISMLSTNMLGKSDFLTGAFPANYGNSLSGVFDINLRNGNADKKEYAFQFGILGADLAIEGPFSKNYKGSYLINYRYSTISLLNSIVEISEGSIPTYQDLSFKINLPLNKSTNLSLWGIGGISEDNTDETMEENFTFSEIFESSTYMSGITLSHAFGKGNKLDARVSLSGNQSNFDFNAKNTLNDETSGDSDFLENSATRFNIDYTKKINSKTTLKSGAILSLLNYNLETKELDNNISNTVVQENGNANMFQAYLLAKHRFTKSFSTSIGLHTTTFSINNNFIVEPRVSFEYKINPKHSLNGGFGLHSRRMPLNQYFININDNTPNANLDLMRASHYILGYDWRIIRNGHLKFEMYYQNLKKVAVAKSLLNTDSFINGQFLTDELVDTGKGENYGLEVTFEKFFSNQYYFLTTASFYSAKYKASNNKWFDSNFNYNFVYNVVGGKEFTLKNKNVLGINGKVIINGGRRGTPLNTAVFNQTGETIIDQNLRNTIQFDNYSRIDISTSYRVNNPKVSHIVSLDVQNITNRNNVFQQFFNDNGNLLTSNQLGIVPFINYKLEF